MKSTKDILTNLGACTKAVKWAGSKTHKQAWNTCKRGDWLLWITSKLGVDRKRIVLAACACAAWAAWAAGDAAWAAAWAAWAAGDAAWAAWAAGDAAGAAWAAGDAAGAAARAAGDAAWAADAAADAAARAAAHKRMAGIIRKIIPFSVICKAIAQYEGRDK
jgi:hypothetical protein